MQLPSEILAALNDELTRERFSAALYLAAAGQFENMNLSGFADWARKASAEETGHAQAFFDYITDRNAPPVLGMVAAVPTLPVDVGALFSAALKQEQIVSEALRQIYAKAMNTGDYFTGEFLLPFLKEQVKSERKLTEIVSKVNSYPNEMLVIEQWLAEAK
jgi:ferritin